MIDREFANTLRSVANKVKRENEAAQAKKQKQQEERAKKIVEQIKNRAQKLIDKIENGCHNRAKQGFFTYRVVKLNNSMFNSTTRELANEAKYIKDFCDTNRIPWRIEYEHDFSGVNADYFFDIYWE